MWNMTEVELHDMLRRNPALRAREMLGRREKKVAVANPASETTPKPHLSESEEQILLFQWADSMVWKYPELEHLYHIPNGGKRSKATAGRLKAEGVKSGVPDLCLPVARGGCFGLYIEMKAQGGRTSKEQNTWLELLRANGYDAVVSVGWEQASAGLLRYLEMPPTVVKEVHDDHI